MKLNWSDVTPHRIYLNRRKFIGASAAALALPALASRAHALTGRPSPLSTDQAPNTFEEITNYNNFYEFGSHKNIHRAARALRRATSWASLPSRAG